jgi:urease accessory protein
MLSGPTDVHLLLLCDGRLPDGAYAHSGGLEALAGLGAVVDIADLAAFLRGRLQTTGLVAAGLAAAAAAGDRSLAELDVAADARMASPATREASRRQGRHLLRAAARAWPSPAYRDLPRRPHHPIVLGVVARIVGTDPAGAALAAAYGAVTGPAGAAVRRLSLDPLEVHAVTAGLASEIEDVAGSAVAAAAAGRLPASSAPMLEIAAEDHATWEVRLFAS